MSKPSRRENRNKQKQLAKSVKQKQKQLRAEKLKDGAIIIHRTQANNTKFQPDTIKAEIDYRKDLVAAQIKAWRATLPSLLNRFSKIKDPRQPGKIKYSMKVLMLYGTLCAIFRFASRREANENMTRPQFIAALHQIFPDLEDMPHADTLANLLERIEPTELESACMSLASNLIRNKRFKKFLIHNSLPLSIDGTQKLVRNRFFNENCHDRTIHTKEGTKKQQYIFIVEANITLFNGLTIPVASEFLHYDLDLPEDAKNDCEMNACKRLIEKIKQHFKHTKFIVYLDGLYPSEPIIQQIISYNWNYMIYLKKTKKTKINSALDLKKDLKTSIPNQPYYRERKQSFYFGNNIPFSEQGDLMTNAVACYESWPEIDPETAEEVTKHSEHRWISNIPFNIENVHQLCNLGARKRALIEDSMNTEKNRGYHYEHALSSSWPALKGYHCLMRLGHALNAISEFTRVLKKHIKEEGVKVVLKLILETLANPWLTAEWFALQNQTRARLLF